RRRFLSRAFGALGGIATAGITPLITACARADARRTKRFSVSALIADGSGTITDVAGADGALIMIVRRSASDYAALSTQCTHAGCPVNAPVAGVITCPCHGSQYNLKGEVLRGPSEFSLLAYRVRLDVRRKEVVVDLGD